MGHDLITSSFLGLRDKLHHIALHYLQSDEDAQDVLQDTWLKLSDKDEVETSFEAKNKLVSILRNICIDRLRKTKAIPIDSISSSDVPQYSLETEDIERLEQLLQQQLTPLQRQIFNLVTHEGCDYDQIAVRLSMSVEAVRMNMSRLRKKIRETLKKLNQ
ncbi:MAG: sigma-70 family RNA polymerase sigma factor [Muribaculaceae bacterium]|nr:sigma-70 family RNA polymerase sigma factor [Muribaculaceae bacterium]